MMGRSLLEGAATNSVINGGKQVVTEGGITTGDIINDGGYQNIGVNGSAFNVVVNKGGRQDINTGGYAKDTTIIGGQYDIDPEATGENVSFDGGLGFVRETGILTGYATLKTVLKFIWLRVLMQIFHYLVRASFMLLMILQIAT